MRTYSRTDWLAARAAWAEGDFGPRWDRARSYGAERGMIYPPSGTVHDDREADEPSQRAIIWRALQDNPRATLDIISRSRSWFDVVDRIVGLEARLREDAGLSDREAQYDRDERPSYSEAVTSISSILERIGGSR